MIDELAKMVAVNFAEWLHKNGYRQSRIECVYWTTDENSTHHKTDELYDKFSLSERERLNT